MTKDKVIQILNFIEKRFAPYPNWTINNSYYFAKILADKFPPLQVYYLPIEDIFVAGIKGYYFTRDGIRNYDEVPYTLEEAKKNSEKLYAELKTRFID